MTTKNFSFYNFILYDYDLVLFDQDYTESNIIFKSKKKLNPRTSLFNATMEVFESFIISKRDLLKHNFPINTKEKEKYAQSSSSYYIGELTKMIKNITCNGFELKEFFDDKETTLDELNSKESPLAAGESINIILKNIDTKFLIHKSITEIEKQEKKYLTDDSKSLSTLSNGSSFNNYDITCFVKMVSDTISFKTSFHQFAIGHNETYNDLLEYIIQYHSKQNHINDDEITILNETKWRITIYSNDKCSPLDRIVVLLNDACKALKSSGKCYVVYKDVIQRVTPKRSNIKRDINQMLMHSSKEIFIPEKMNGTNFPNKLFNHCVNMYEKNNLYVDASSLPRFTELTRSIRNVLQCLHHRIPKNKIPKVFHHNITKYQNRTRIGQQFIRNSANSLLQSMNICNLLFLSNTKWAEFQALLEELYDLCNSCIEDMQHRSKLEKERQNKPKEEVNENRLQRYEVVMGKKDCKISSMYETLYSKLSSIEYYKHIIVSPDDIDKWMSNKIKPDESNVAKRKRRQRFRDNMIFPNLSYASYLWHMGTNLSSSIILWKVPCLPENRSDEKQAICISQSMQYMPEYNNRKHFASFNNQYKDVMGASVPNSMLQHMYTFFTKDARKSRNQLMDERILKYCLSRGNPDLWPDLRAANSGAKEKYTIFFDEAQKVIEQISGVDAYRHGEKNYLTSENSDLTSIPALYTKIVSSIKNSSDFSVKNAPLPSESLLRVSLCPQYESREVSKNYTCKLNLTRAIQKATMRKNNIDSYYNHKLNQYCNLFIIEFNKLVYSHFQNHEEYPTKDNDIIFTKGVTKISVDDKAAIPVGEPGLPVRTNTRKMSSSLTVSKIKNQPIALDHDFHRANIRPSVAIFIKTPTTNSSWRRGTVTIALKDGALEKSTSMRHFVELSKQINELSNEDSKLLQQKSSLPFGFLVRSDGGNDRNPKNASVLIGSIYFFLKNDLDFAIFLITAADISHVNEAEGVMPICNLVLQNQAYARNKMSDKYEKLFSSANSAKSITRCIENAGNDLEKIKAKEAWRESMSDVKEMIGKRFAKLHYSNIPIQVFDAANEIEIKEAYILIKNTIDNPFDENNTNWQHIRNNNNDLMKFIKSHCRRERYHLEIFKCGKVTCKICKPIRMPNALWNEIIKRPRFIPLPVPKKKIIKMKKLNMKTTIL